LSRLKILASFCRPKRATGIKGDKCTRNLKQHADFSSMQGVIKKAKLRFSVLLRVLYEKRILPQKEEILTKNAAVT
jgi:hypothetical protein